MADTGAKAKIVIEGDSTSAERAITKVKGKINEFGQSLRGTASSAADLGGAFGVAGRLASLAGPVGLAAAAVGAFGVVVNHAAQAVDDLNDTAAGLNLTTSSLADLQIGARESGLGIDALQGALTKLNVKLTDAAGGGKESIALFQALGVAVTGPNGKLRDTEAVLKDVADRFSSYRDGAAKSALAVELFGRSGSKLVSFLNQGGDGLKRNSGLTEEAAKGAAKLAAEFDKLTAYAERVKNSFYSWLIPAVNDAYAAFKGDGELPSEELLGRLSARLADLTKQRAALMENPLPGLQKQLTRNGKPISMTANLDAQIEATQTALYKLRESQRRLVTEDGKRDPPVVSKIDNTATEAYLDGLRKQYIELTEGKDAAEEFELAKKKLGAADRVLASVLLGAINAEQRFRDTMNERIKVQKAATDANRARVEEFDRSGQEELDRINAETQAIGLNQLQREKANAARQIEQQLRKAWADPNTDQETAGALLELGLAQKTRQARAIEQRATADAGAAVRQYAEDVEFQIRTLGLSNDQVQRATMLRDLERRGLDESSAGYAELVDGIDRATAAVRQLDLAQEAAQVKEAFVDVFRGSTTDALAEFISGTKSAKDAFRDFVSSVEQQLARLAAQNIAESLFGKQGSGGAGGVDWGKLIGGLVGLFGGNGAKSGPAPGEMPGRAAGGPVSAGMPYMVGEKGREIFVPRTSGTVVPNHALGGLSVGAINVNVPGGTSRATAGQTARELVRSLSVARARYA